MPGQPGGRPVPATAGEDAELLGSPWHLLALLYRVRPVGTGRDRLLSGPPPVATGRQGPPVHP